MKTQDYYKILEPIIKNAGQKAKDKWEKFDREKSLLKSKTEIVTQVDKDTEKLLIKNIKKAFPSHGFLGEEFGSKKSQADYIWIIDPIDGTTNFSIHNPLWCISIGLAYKNEIIFGIIYVPVLNELFWSEKDKGSFLNNKKMKLPSLNKAKIIHTFCHGQRKRDLKVALNYYRDQKMKSLDCRQLGSAAIEIAYVASGRVDSIMIPGIKVWDVAAGALIAKESGVNVLNFKGENWQLSSEDIIVCHPEIKNDILKRVKRAMK
jgi:myo-inositol-1(or 4)-monophosphatase